jgi:hypothetical protein
MIHRPTRSYCFTSFCCEVFRIKTVADALNNVSVQSKNFIQVMGDVDRAANRVGDAYFWNGRPDWDQVFARRKKMRKVENIGVCFCGATNIGKDLKRMCAKYSSTADKCIFTLHKENF